MYLYKYTEIKYIIFNILAKKNERELCIEMIWTQSYYEEKDLNTAIVFIEINIEYIMIGIWKTKKEMDVQNILYRKWCMIKVDVNKWKVIG